MKRVEITPNKSLCNKLANAMVSIDDTKTREKAESMLKEIQLPSSRGSPTASSSTDKKSIKQKLSSVN